MPRPARGFWRCPRCGRRFARLRQAHSCQVVPLRMHLARAGPQVLAAYRAILAILESCGPLQVVPTKTSLNLLSRTSLGGLTLRRDHLDVGLLLTRRLRHPRVRWVLQLSPRSFAHRVRVGSPEDVDGQLAGWLREAYQVGLMAGRRLPG